MNEKGGRWEYQSRKKIPKHNSILIEKGYLNNLTYGYIIEN